MTISALIAKLGDLIAFPVERDAADPSRSRYERLAIPHTFRPRLSVAEAAIAATGTMLRILLGSLLFALWGTCTWMAWDALHNQLLRGVVTLISVLLFLVVLTGVLIAIAAVFRLIWPQRRPLSRAPEN